MKNFCFGFSIIHPEPVNLKERLAEITEERMGLIKVVHYYSELFENKYSRDEILNMPLYELEMLRTYYDDKNKKSSEDGKGKKKFYDSYNSQISGLFNN